MTSLIKLSNSQNSPNHGKTSTFLTKNLKKSLQDERFEVQ